MVPTAGQLRSESAAMEISVDRRDQARRSFSQSTSRSLELVQSSSLVHSVHDSAKPWKSKCCVLLARVCDSMATPLDEASLSMYGRCKVSAESQ